MKVILRPIPKKYLERLDSIDRKRIRTAMDGLKQEPPAGDIKPLVGQPGYYRLKIGGYRILYRIEKETVFVTHIEPRGQAYTKKTRSTI